MIYGFAAKRVRERKCATKHMVYMVVEYADWDGWCCQSIDDKIYGVYSNTYSSVGVFMNDSFENVCLKFLFFN